MTRRMVRMLLFDSLIAVGLPGDGNKQLLATITTDPWGLQPSSQNISKPFPPSHPPLLLHSPLALLFSIQVLVSSQRHCDQNKTIFQDRVLWENVTSIEGGVEGKSGDVFLLFGDLHAWNNDAAYPQFALLTFVWLGLSERPSDNYLWNQFWWWGQISVDSGRNGPFEKGK